MVRAKRLEEIPLLENAWKEEKALLKHHWDEQEEERVCQRWFVYDYLMTSFPNSLFGFFEYAYIFLVVL